MDLLAIAAEVIQASVAMAQEEGEAAASGLQINLFWVIVASLNFLVFATVLYYLFGGTVSRLLAERRARIEQGLRDAEQARRDRERAQEEHAATLAEARREAQEVLNRAQRIAQEAREADMAATREELERMRVRAASDIDAEKQRAISELRREVADLALAAASRVLGESMTDERQRRLVDEFLAEAGTTGARSSERPR